jgi:hypothetical protein
MGVCEARRSAADETDAMSAFGFRVAQANGIHP